MIREGADRARPLAPLVVEALAASIQEQGLMQPIVVRKVDETYYLIAGRHRLEAVRSLGRDNIMVHVLAVTGDDEAKLAEVMELILGDKHPDIDNVTSAQDFLSDGVVCDPLEKRFVAASQSMANLDDDMFDKVIASHEERVITSLKRRGRI